MPTPELIQAAVAVVSFVGAALALWWRLTARLHSFVGAQTSTLAAVKNLETRLAVSTKKIAERLDYVARDLETFRRELATFSVLMHEREKDISRVEGQLEQLGAIVVKQVAAVNGVLSSVDAVWRTLQTLHPERVPKRASDRP